MDAKWLPADARALVRERGISIECCPVSNDRMGFVPVANHPLPLFLTEGLRASVSTDDPLMFGAFSVADMWEEIAGALPLDDVVALFPPVAGG